MQNDEIIHPSYYASADRYVILYLIFILIMFEKMPTKFCTFNTCMWHTTDVYRNYVIIYFRHKIRSQSIKILSPCFNIVPNSDQHDMSQPCFNKKSLKPNF